MASWGTPDVTVVGAGLAGSEAAWQLAERGFKVALVEMKPAVLSPAHQSPLLCELVCSNSLRSVDPVTPAGLLKEELRAMGSMVLRAAETARVPAGSALGVDRFAFGRAVTIEVATHHNIRLERRVVDELPAGPVILATGPLTGGRLARWLGETVAGESLYFYDAIAPIVAADSIDPEHAFVASRWGKGDERDGAPGDYLNCPMSKDEYRAFVAAVQAARKVLPHRFEEPRYFESCLPIEVMADRGDDVLRFGPMRPVGLTDPRTGRWAYAVVQLRTENRHKTAYNLVGFQTRLAYPEQQRVFSMIPALRNAEFLRFGSIHRNTYLDAPRLVGPGFELKARPEVRLAGLLTGVEGYIESCAMGLLCARMLAAALAGEAHGPPPATTMMGALYRHVTEPREDKKRHAPTNVNFGLLPPLEDKVKKDDKKPLMAARATADLAAWLETTDQRGPGSHVSFPSPREAGGGLGRGAADAPPQ